MSNIFHQNVSAGRGKTLADGWQPISLHFVPSHHAIMRFANGNEAASSCLRCPDTPCATFSERETMLENFNQFPADRNTEVCPAGAITRPVGGGAPIINAEHCILCGVCASRCPVGAIRLVQGYGAIVEDAPNVAFIETATPSKVDIDLERQRFKELPREGSFLVESDTIVDDIFERLQRAWTRVGDRFPNLLTRNLLISTGIEAAVGRKGNNHMRMDIVLSPPGVEHGVAEVEFGQDAVLDAPRDILDALAVLVSRYDWTLQTTSAIVVSDVLPNRRSEYWRIVQDIHQVLGVKIGTVTIFALMLTVWNRNTLNLMPDNDFYTDLDTDSYRTCVLESMLGRPLNLGKVLRPYVEVAK